MLVGVIWIAHTFKMTPTQIYGCFRWVKVRALKSVAASYQYIMELVVLVFFRNIVMVLGR